MQQWIWAMVHGFSVYIQFGTIPMSSQSVMHAWAPSLWRLRWLGLGETAMNWKLHANQLVIQPKVRSKPKCKCRTVCVCNPVWRAELRKPHTPYCGIALVCSTTIKTELTIEILSTGEDLLYWVCCICIHAHKQFWNAATKCSLDKRRR